ncbi:MAG: Ig-like domain-containing protein [Desulfobacteraceae bacterium]|nr:Ig-like domain-containing protein [Desulfobacteraceae bacterium]
MYFYRLSLSAIVLSLSGVLLFLSISVLNGCSQKFSEEDRSADSFDRDSGAVAMQLKWGPSGSDDRIAFSPSGDVCADYGITNIRATIFNDNRQSVASALWACGDNNHSGTLRDVPPGTNMLVMVEGIIGFDSFWVGQRDSFEVIAGQTTQLGVITMQYKEPNPAPAVESHAPAANASNVALNPTIEVTFSEDVLPVTINSRTFLVLSGGVGIAGSVAYTPETHKAVFILSNYLAYSTVYTVRLTAGIEDRQGKQLAPAEWSFTTLCLRHTITATVNSGGIISPSGDVLVCDGAQPTFTISRPTLSQIDQLYIDSNPVLSQPVALFINPYQYTFSPVMKDHTIRAVTSDIPIIISSASPAVAGEDQLTLTPSDSPAALESRQSVNSAPNTIWYVDNARQIAIEDGPQDGRSWEGALSTIQAAVDAAADGDEIWVAGRQYDLTGAIAIDRKIELYGGFSGNEAQRGLSDRKANPTILNAHSPGGSSATRCFLFYPGAADTRIDGFIIQNGLGEKDLSPHRKDPCGLSGALYINHAKPVLANCSLRHNRILRGEVTGQGNQDFDTTLSIENCFCLDTGETIGPLEIIFNPDAGP